MTDEKILILTVVTEVNLTKHQYFYKSVQSWQKKTMVKKVNTNYKGHLKRKETEPNKMEDDLMMDYK